MQSEEEASNAEEQLDSNRIVMAKAYHLREFLTKLSFFKITIFNDVFFL